MKQFFKRKSDDGTITMEACIVMPVFIFVIVFVYGIMMMFSGQQMITHALIQSAESLSMDSYSDSMLNKEDNLVYRLYKKVITVNGDIKNVLQSETNFSSKKSWTNPEKVKDQSERNKYIKRRFVGFLTNEDDISEGEKQAKELLKKYGVENGLDGIDFSECKLDDKELTVKIKYKQNFLFDFQGLASFDREMEIKVHMW